MLPQINSLLFINKDLQIKRFIILQLTITLGKNS